ncbi:MAG TPA: hypothetical protein VH418_13815, partial [Solirubrobacteraceae bacterium]
MPRHAGKTLIAYAEQRLTLPYAALYGRTGSGLSTIEEEGNSLSTFGSEVIGTAILILLGDGVVAAVLLYHSKAQNAGWIVITFGWGMA